MVFFYTFVCLIELQYVDLFPESAKAEEINNILSTTLGALASGILIYFITSWLPDWLERRRWKKTLGKGIENVNVLLANMIPGFSVIKIDNEKRVIKIDQYIERIRQVNWNDKSEGSEAKKILENFRFLKTHILNFLLVAQKHLSKEQIDWLYEISNSSFEQLITPSIYPHGDVKQQIIEEYGAILECNKKLQQSAGCPSNQKTIYIGGSPQ